MSSIRIVADAQFQKWIAGLSSFAPTAVEEELFADAGDVMFEYSQEFVHVISGDLKSSGRVSSSLSGSDTEVTIEYGGNGIVDYALAEENRGGSHAYLTRAYEAAAGIFERQLGLALDAQFERLD